MVEAADGSHELVAFGPVSIRGRKLLDAALGDLPLERKIATSLAPALDSGGYEAVSHDDDISLRWHRLPVADGIELHVREDSPAAREEAVIAMREAVRAALGRGDIR